MSKLEDPEIKVKQAAVVTVYPGASAHQVELEVTDVLEKSIRSMKDIGEVTSRSMNDMSLINVSLSTLVTNEETEQCWDILRRKVADVQAEPARRSLRIRGNGRFRRRIRHVLRHDLRRLYRRRGRTVCRTREKRR